MFMLAFPHACPHVHLLLMSDIWVYRIEPIHIAVVGFDIKSYIFSSMLREKMKTGIQKYQKFQK